MQAAERPQRRNKTADGIDPTTHETDPPSRKPLPPNTKSDASVAALQTRCRSALASARHHVVMFAKAFDEKKERVVNEAVENWHYGELATAVYELDKPVGFSFGDIEFYSERLAGVTGPILEPGVGTGRFLIPLAEAGFDVQGFDASPYMLKVCERNCIDRGLSLKLSDGDMETHHKDNAYEAIVIPTGSIMLLSGWGATFKALRNMRRSLRPGGRLLVDVPPLDVSTESGPIRHWWRGEDLLTLQTWHVDYDAVTQRVTRWQRYELWQRGCLVTTELQLFSLQCFRLVEFAGLLKEAGFRKVTAFGGYEARPPRDGDAMWTFEAVV